MSTSPDQLAEIICTTTDSGARRRAEQELEAILERDHLAVVGGTNSAYTIVCSSVLLVQLFKRRRHEGGPCFIEGFLASMLDALEALFRVGPAVPWFAVKSLLAALCKCQKLAIDGWDAAPKAMQLAMHVTPQVLHLGGLLDPSANGGKNADADAAPPCQLVAMVLQRAASNPDESGAVRWHYLRILADLVEEMSKFDGSKANLFMNFSAHRRASTAFRDASLRPMLPLLLSCLDTIVRSDNSNNNGGASNSGGAHLVQRWGDMHLSAVCDLARQLFNYDFMAIIIDETEESFVTQYPTEWRDVLLDTRDALIVVRELQQRVPPPYCTTMLRAATGLIGARRTFFVAPEQKTAWLDFFMDMLMCSTSGAGHRMADVQFCGTLAEAVQRFLPPHTYQCLADCPNFGQFLQWVADFSRTVFEIPFGNGGSFQTTTTLMIFWNRIINSKRIALANQQPPVDIENFVPELIRVFTATRLTRADVDIDEDAVDAVGSQTDLLPTFFAVRTAECLEGIAGMLVAATPDVICGHPSTLLWACHTGACLVRSLVPNVNEETCLPLAAFIRVLCSSCSQYLCRRTPGSFAALEHAVIAYLASLQLVFTSIRLAPNVVTLLTEVFGEKHNLFQFLLDSVGSNITSNRLDVETIDGSLDIIIEACGDLPTAQLMRLSLDVPPAVDLPMSHSAESYKLRSKLHHALYIVRLPDPFGVDDFHRFLAPIQQLMRSGQQDPLFVGGWLRDIKGVASACANSEGAFAELLEWTTQNSDVFYAIAGAPSLPSAITDSLLKLLRQLVTPPRQTGSRLNIPSMCHSPSGLLLMQLCMRIVHDVLNGLRCPPVPTAGGDGEAATVTSSEADHIYETYLKHVQTAMNIARLCVTGDFCPFGAMALYGDTRFADAVAGIVRMMSAVPIKLIKEFSAVAGTLSQLLSCLVSHQLVTPFITMGPDEVQFVIRFALSVVGDTETRTQDLAVALDFLGWVASTRPVIERDDPTGGRGTVQPAASPRYMMRQARWIFGRKLASLGMDIYDLIAMAAMDVVTSQDRCMPQASSCAYPIFDADAGAFRRYTEYLVGQYARSFHRERVQQLLAELAADVPTQERFFSKLVEFRGALRTLGL